MMFVIKKNLKLNRSQKLENKRKLTQHFFN